ncbi:RING finger protein 225 [Microcaecilia unicolor]|uniref:RING finger protein 225-like n=1 Tax=Microcaecilia unicolor TaxID=1415580 RepID=A0A6P7XDC6_9AMPH|nr:RING finger protein 225-like [Microcaecilia unicolor]XP_030051236.1 RING finger protein 225-like [Microcaecilia unicolor]XP_030051237.1 RING finger protein 225-like [Microcaecilia unicolor]
MSEEEKDSRRSSSVGSAVAQKKNATVGATNDENAKSSSSGTTVQEDARRYIMKEETVGASANDDASSSDGTECVICFTQYDNVFKLPKVLQCGHTFCLECLARINVSSEEVNSVTCPICRNATRLSAKKGLPALDTDTSILSQLPGGSELGSVRFSRKKGLLYVKDKGTPVRPHLPKPLQVSSVSLSLDVGRPTPRSRIPLGCVRGSWLFYIAVSIAIILTLGLVMSGIYIFFLLPYKSPGGSSPIILHHGNSSMMQAGRNVTTPKNW